MLVCTNTPSFIPLTEGEYLLERDMDYKYTTENLTLTIKVPKGFVTDFASIPSFLFWLIKKDGPILIPAVLHDYLYATNLLNKTVSDSLFFQLMETYKVSKLKRHLVFLAVLLLGRRSWNNGPLDLKNKLLRLKPAEKANVYNK